MKFYEIPCDEIGYFREKYDFLSNFYPTKVFLHTDNPTWGARQMSAQLKADESL